MEDLIKQNVLKFRSVLAHPETARRFFLTVSTFLLAIFPLVGNALTYQTPIPRRLGQAFLVVIALVSYFKGMPPARLLELWRTVLGSRSFWRCFSLALIVLFGSILFNRFSLTQFPTAHSVLVLCLVIAWCFLLSAVFYVSPPSTPFFRDDSIRYPPDRKEFSRSAFFIFAAVGGFCFLKAWWCGPEAPQAYIDFGGSEILLAICGCVGFFSLLFCYPFLPALVAAMPFAYLILFSTGRTAAFVMTAMLLLLSLSRLISARRSLLRRVVSAIGVVMLPLAAMWIFMVVPIHFESRWWPFYTPIAKVSAIPDRVDEIYNRLSRVLRLVAGLSRPDLKGLLDDPRYQAGVQKLIHVLSLGYDAKSARAQERLSRVLYFGQNADSRVALIRETWHVIRERPVGSWPAAFDEQVGVVCEGDKKCTYPHNLFLEVAFYFGWVVSLFFLLSLFYLGIRLILQLARASWVLPNVIAVSLLVHLMAMQITGTLMNHFIPLLLLGYWLTEKLVMRSGNRASRL